jgi:triphosphoribosyl-dephospho-CoA synthase
MLRVTKGSNTHKGAIWTLGLLAAAAAATQCSLDAFDIAITAGVIASFEDAQVSTFVSHGELVARKFGVKGARGEAMEGFPHIVTVGLPALRARRDDRAPEQIARLDALLSIMAELDEHLSALPRRRRCGCAGQILPRSPPIARFGALHPGARDLHPELQ